MANQPIEREHREWVLSALERYESRLTRYAVRLVGDPHVARDAVQHTFLQLCDADRDRISAYLAAWLYTVCRNMALDLARGRDRVESLNGKRSGRLEGREANPTEAVEKQDLSLWLGRLLDELPGTQKEVLELLLDGFSYAAIAEITDRSPGNIRVIAHRAISSLREDPRVRQLIDSDTETSCKGELKRPDPQPPISQTALPNPPDKKLRASS